MKEFVVATRYSGLTGLIASVGVMSLHPHSTWQGWLLLGIVWTALAAWYLAGRRWAR